MAPLASSGGRVSPPRNPAKIGFSFEAVWADLRNRLRRGSDIKVWSRDGYTGRQFRIVDVSGDAITILPQPRPYKSKPQQRRVGKTDFAQVYSEWSRYCEGLIKRTEMSSQNTTYIFSILHWRELTDA